MKRERESTYFGPAVQQLPGEWQDAEDDIEPAIVDEYSSASVSSFFEPDEPVLHVIDEPWSL